jgi:hypothetical protein
VFGSPTLGRGFLWVLEEACLMVACAADLLRTSSLGL